MARKYYFSRPLSDVLEKRKRYHVNRVEAALDKLYAKGDASTIEKYERALYDLSRAMAAGKLERKVSGGSRSQRSRRVDERPELDYKTYVRARNSGLDNDDIKIWFKTDSRRQVAGFNGAYSRYKAKTKRTKTR